MRSPAQAKKPSSPENLDKLLAEIRACRICEKYLPHGVRPIVRASATAKLCISAQAPGLRVHETGLTFNDPSGDRLRDWLGLDRETFYDESRVAIVGIGSVFRAIRKREPTSRHVPNARPPGTSGFLR